MSLTSQSSRHARLVTVLGASLACGACTTVDPAPTPDRLLLTTAQVQSLDSSAHVIVQANPTNTELKSLVDSTLLVLTAGVEAKRLSVNTDLTAAPLYFVGVHRAVSRASDSYSTWTIVGFDSPSQLANLVEVSGFAQSAGSTVPTSVSGTIGDGTGVVNSMLLQVAAGGSVTQWRATTGTASLSSDAPGVPCPGFVATAIVTCALETMHVHFDASAPSGSGGAGARHATVGTDIDVPAMRLTYTPPQ